MSIKEKLLKTSTIKATSVLDESIIFSAKDMIPTPIPALNIALSGSLSGGLTPGLTIFAGPSRHFKSMFTLVTAKSYLDKYDDAVILFYDSEFGTPEGYFRALGIDPNRVVHTPIVDIEQLKHDVTNQLNSIERGDKVIIVIDSIGNLASKKEADDALEGKSAADMTRAKQLKSLFRIVTPHLTLKNIPMVVVGHTYQTMEIYSKPVLSGGTGIFYSADNIFIVGRQQDKDGQELLGYKFILNVEKSRYVKEKSKIPIEVSFEGGLSTWSGLLDIGLESGFVTKPKVGWYSKIDPDTGEVDQKNYRQKETNTGSFWLPILRSENFRKFIETRYKVSGVEKIISDHDIDEAIEE